jgi:Cu(I)/Ag(I) efflux system membrane fusion protein
MKNKSIYIVGILALVIGFAIAWFIKPNVDQSQVESNLEHDHSSSDPQTWTCSMHPQIQQPEAGACAICGMDLIPLDNSSSSDDPLVLEMTKEAVKLADIQTTVMGATSNAEKTISLNGKIQADERRSSSQAAHIPGRIEQLFITFTGEQVKKGQKLATIYSPELVTAQRELLEALKFIEINPKLTEAARKKLLYWKIPEATIEVIEQSGMIQETFTLYAETNGVVTNRRISVGDYVKKGQVLLDIINLNKLWVLFDGYEEDLANIKVGDKIEFTTPALPGKSFQTRVNFIDPVINPKTRVAALRGEISNNSGLLKPEMFVKGEVKASLSGKEQLMVPKSSVLWTGKRSVVYVKVPDMAVPSFKYREVTLGASLGNNYLIEDGLEPGEEIVTHGSFSIDAAAQLNNQQSMMNQRVSVKGAAETASTTPDYSTQSPSAFKTQLNTLIEAYFGIKNAFVLTDSEAALLAVQPFISQLEKIDVSLLKGDAHLYWMKQLKGMQGHSEAISKSKEIEPQRIQFSFLSELMIQTITAFGYDGDTLFIQNCPMAMKDEGANWISDEAQIKNPYFGDKMMKCGTVTSTFPMEK